MAGLVLIGLGAYYLNRCAPTPPLISFLGYPPPPPSPPPFLCLFLGKFPAALLLAGDMFFLLTGIPIESVTCETVRWSVSVSSGYKVEAHDAEHAQ